jgi:carbon storage regulator CsrA
VGDPHWSDRVRGNNKKELCREIACCALQTADNRAGLVGTLDLGETIVITTAAGERIRIAILGQTGNQVRIGTDAPAEFSILREELLQAPTT